MQLKPGTLLQGGKYRIEKVLGQGGFGITYLASQTISIEGPIGSIKTEIKLAVKEFFMSDICNREPGSNHVSVPSVGSHQMVSRFKEKFIKEARNISELKHPYIIKVVDVFEENGTAYYVVTPVVLKADNVEVEPIPETTEEVTTEAPAVTEPATEPTTEPITEPVAEGGCGTMISFSLLALIPAAVLIIKKKED